MNEHVSYQCACQNITPELSCSPHLPLPKVTVALWKQRATCYKSWFPPIRMRKTASLLRDWPVEFPQVCFHQQNLLEDCSGVITFFWYYTFVVLYVMEPIVRAVYSFWVNMTLCRFISVTRRECSLRAVVSVSVRISICKQLLGNHFELPCQISFQLRNISFWEWQQIKHVSELSFSRIILALLEE